MHYDVVIVGGGIAGASLAYALRARGVDRVVVVEREAQPGYHATGRSAAALVEYEVDLVVQRVLADAAPFFRDPPPGFSDEPIFDPTGVALLYDEPEWTEVCAVAPEVAERGTEFTLLAPASAAAYAPAAAALDIAGAVWLPGGGRIDVPALLRGYLRGVDLRCGATVTGIARDGERCAGVELGTETLRAGCVVNAAGPWAGALAALADAAPIPLAARRRTVVTFAPPADTAVDRWPLVAYETRRLYYAPERGRLLASPMDEGASEPCDAVPDAGDVDTALCRLRAWAPAIAPAAPGPARAGLRTFAPDRRFVVGPDPRRPGFVWLAGQGGWGIETSPTLSRIAADFVTAGATGWADAGALNPGRF